MMEFREINKADDAILAGIIRSNLKANKLDIPGTAYFDDHLDHLSDYYLADRTKRYYFIAVENDEIIGGIGLAELGFFDDCGELQKLYLTDKAKGRGIGYTLIRLIEDKARELGYKKIYLETHSNLAAAIHIYERSGYREIEKPAGVVHATMDRFFIKELNG
ncbi:MAG: GNAT family N-acetyltransferase [Lachnospiraceae bacterium]|nr:GNAT family N-acetyltransferase [Lachnospiraceae bacterium]MBR6486143.1 GNAT family N-acetyltransferase [Lachnospiraceae bacterium]